MIQARISQPFAGVAACGSTRPTAACHLGDFDIRVLFCEFASHLALKSVVSQLIVKNEFTRQECWWLHTSVSEIMQKSGLPIHDFLAEGRDLLFKAEIVPSASQ